MAGIPEVGAVTRILDTARVHTTGERETGEPFGDDHRLAAHHSAPAKPAPTKPAPIAQPEAPRDGEIAVA